MRKLDSCCGYWVAGDVIRARLRKEKKLKLAVRHQVGKAYTPEEKARLLAAAKVARSPAIYPALMLALNAGMRDSEIRGLQWVRVNLAKTFLIVGESKTEAGEGRTIPLNSALAEAMVEYSKWYTKHFGIIQPNWYVFAFGKPWPKDPTRPMVTLKTSWRNVKTKAGVSGRWHDNRHTLITDLAESGAGDETIRDIAGHVSKQMLKHYSHIRMEAKRRALEAIVPGAKLVEQKPAILALEAAALENSEGVPTKVPTLAAAN
jgi:integrase